MDRAAANRTFDVTPPDLVDGVFTERGRLAADDVSRIAEELSEYSAWRGREYAPPAP